MDPVLYLYCRTEDCVNSRQGVKPFCAECLAEYKQVRKCLNDDCNNKRHYQKNGMLYRFCWPCEKTLRETIAADAPTCLYCPAQTAFNYSTAKYYNLCKNCYAEKKCPNFETCHNYRFFNDKTNDYYKTCGTCRNVNPCKNDSCDQSTLHRDTFCPDCQHTYDEEECIFITYSSDLDYEYCGNKTFYNRREVSRPVFCTICSKK